MCQPMKEWLYTRIVLRALKVSYSDESEGGVTVNCEENTIIPEHPVPDIYGLQNEQ